MSGCVTTREEEPLEAVRRAQAGDREAFVSSERTLVATTDTDWADDYDLARAVLDRIMASLEFSDAGS